jgi:hypothetical protein
MKTKVIWIPGYQPFIMGGNVNTPWGCRVNVGPLIKLAKGVGIREARFDTGETLAVEERTGGVCADSIKEAKRDLKSAPFTESRKTIDEQASWLASNPPKIIEQAEWLKIRAAAK